MLAIEQKDYPPVSDYPRRRCQDSRTPVNQIIRRITRARAIAYELGKWGESFWDRYRSDSQ
jgi:hypothetical protein